MPAKQKQSSAKTAIKKTSKATAKKTASSPVKPAPVKRAPQKQLISIVVPCFNEVETIDKCHEELRKTVDPMTAYDFEFVYINDGSRDATLDSLKRLRQGDSRIQIVSFSRNFGKEIAVTAGLDHARGDAVVITDADLQDPPEVIPQLIEPWAKEGYDIVYAQRVTRLGETWLKKCTAHAFYHFINLISRVEIPRNTGDFRLMNRRSVDALLKLREHHRFMKGLFAWVGYRQKAVRYHRQPRYAGRTKWNYISLWNLSLEGITGFSLAPLKIATLAGIMISLFSFLFGIYILMRTLLSGSDVPGYPSLMIMVTFLSGIQLLTIGILGEYVGRIFNEVKNRPLYIVDEHITTEEKETTRSK